MAYEDRYLEFEQYIRATESEPKERAELWQTAIGLQKVDGLSVSDYLIETAKKHIEGEVSIDDVDILISTYYRSEAAHEIPDDIKEADEVSKNIVRALSEPSFSFSVQGLAGLHRRVFKGVMKHAGDFRQYNITKKEWVLDGETVLYGPFEDLARTIEYDLEQERKFRYKGLTQIQIIEHLAHFISGIWQIHPFHEGNTRTIAVFLIKYLRSMGIPAANDMFKEHSWYFRNALVRASYKGLNISPTTVFVERFLRNVILGEKNELRNRDMLVGVSLPTSTGQSITSTIPKYQFDTLNCTLEELAVLKIIEDNPKITQTEIAKSIQKSASTVKRITSDLVKKGIISRRNGRRNGWWEILSKE